MASSAACLQDAPPPCHKDIFCTYVTPDCHLPLSKKAHASSPFPGFFQNFLSSGHNCGHLRGVLELGPFSLLFLELMLNFHDRNVRPFSLLCCLWPILDWGFYFFFLFQSNAQWITKSLLSLISVPGVMPGTEQNTETCFHGTLLFSEDVRK